MKPKSSSTSSIFSSTLRVALTLACTSAASFALDWDPSTDPGIQQGDGTWNSATENTVWTADAGATNTFWTNASPAVFNGPAGTSVVSLAANLSAAGLTFTSSGYTLQSTSSAVRTLSLSGDIDLAAGTSNNIGSNMIVSRGALRVGAGPSASVNSGTINIASGSAINSTSGAFNIDGNGTVVNVSGSYSVTAGTGTLNLGTGGLGTTDVTLNIKSGGKASVEVSSATGSQNIMQVGFAGSTVSDPNLVKGTVNVETGGLLKVGVTGNKTLRLGQYGAGFLNVEGNVQCDSIAMGNGGSGYGVIYLKTGGTITTGNINMAKAGSIANFNGGTLKALSAGSLITGTFGTINVRNGGLIVDSNTFDSIIPRALLHSSIGGDNATDGGLTKVGTGKLTLTAANTYTGPTTISAGTLELGDGGTILPGNVSAAGVLAFNKTTDVVFSDIVSGTGGISHTGTGKLSLTNANTYIGTTTVTTGVLELNNGNALSNSSRLVINGTGTVQLTQSETVKTLTIGGVSKPIGTYGITGSGAGTPDDINFSGGGVLTVLAVEPTELFWDTSTASGFQKGSGDWSLTAENWSQTGTELFPWVQTFAANFSGDDSSATVNVAQNLSAAGLNFLSSGYTISAASARTVTSTGAMLVSSGKSATIGNNITITKTTGDFEVAGSGTTAAGSLTIASGATVSNTGTGRVQILGTGTIVDVNGTLLTTGTGNGAARINIAATDGSATLNINSGGLVQTNVGHFEIAQGNNSTGVVNVNSGGTLKTTGAGGNEVRVGNGVGVTGSVGTLNVNAGALVDTGGSNLKLGLGGVGQVTSNLNLNGGTVLMPRVDFGGGLNIVKLNGSELKASAAATNFFNGGGEAGSAVHVHDGGVIFNSNGFNITATASMTHSTLGGAAATDGGLTKTGAGTLTLTGASTYNGPTVINTGTLRINGSQSGATGAVAVNNTATLGGIGTTGGNVTVTSDANIAPGVTAGTLTTGNLDISAMAAGAGTLQFELDALAGTNDQINAQALTIGSGVLGISDLSITNLGGLEVGTYTLITSTGFTGTVDGATGPIATGFTGQLVKNGNNLDLVVTAGGSPYATWLTGFTFPGGADTTPTGDPDMDGLSNQQEFAFGLNPTTGSSVNPIKVPLSKSSGTFTYTRYANSGLTYKILTSTTLSGWTEDVTATDTQVQGTPDGSGNQEVVVTLTGTKPLAAGKLFVRVSAN